MVININNTWPISTAYEPWGYILHLQIIPPVRQVKFCSLEVLIARHSRPVGIVILMISGRSLGIYFLIISDVSWLSWHACPQPEDIFDRFVHLYLVLRCTLLTCCVMIKMRPWQVCIMAAGFQTCKLWLPQMVIRSGAEIYFARLYSSKFNVTRQRLDIVRLWSGHRLKMYKIWP